MLHRAILISTLTAAIQQRLAQTEGRYPRTPKENAFFQESVQSVLYSVCCRVCVPFPRKCVDGLPDIAEIDDVVESTRKTRIRHAEPTAGSNANVDVDVDVDVGEMQRSSAPPPVLRSSKHRQHQPSWFVSS